VCVCVCVCVVFCVNVYPYYNILCVCFDCFCLARESTTIKKKTALTTVPIKNGDCRIHRCTYILLWHCYYRYMIYVIQYIILLLTSVTPSPLIMIVIYGNAMTKSYSYEKIIIVGRWGIGEGWKTIRLGLKDNGTISHSRHDEIAKRNQYLIRAHTRCRYINSI